MISKTQDHTNTPIVYIISGLRQSGKTTFLLALSELLSKRGLITGGFAAPGHFENGQRLSFHLLDLMSGQVMPLCSRRFMEGEQIGPFRFSADGQRFGKSLLQPENLANADFTAIDEIGPLELKGGGWANSLNTLLESSSSKQIWVVRNSLVQAVITQFALKKVFVLDINEITVEEAANLLCDH